MSKQRSLHRGVLGATIALVVGLSLVVGASARPASRASQVTLTAIVQSASQSTWEALVANFEKAYPNITISTTYAPSNTTLYADLTTEFAAGNGPDIVWVTPGNGTPASVVTLAAAGYLMPLVKAPWLTRTVPSIVSLLKYGKGLYAFGPGLGFYGLMVNNALFKQHGWAVPTTFGQLLNTCKTASAAGVAPFLVPDSSNGESNTATFTMQLEITAETNPNFISELKAGKASFATDPGWNGALARFEDMIQANCFPSSDEGLTVAQMDNDFANGQGLMLSANSPFVTTISLLNPSLNFSLVPFPNGNTAAQDRTMVYGGSAFAVNAKSANTASALDFINFAARPNQNQFWANQQGEMTQYDIKKDIVPTVLSAFATQVKKGRLISAPVLKWWNASVSTALNTDVIGLLTGQETPTQILQAMDTAWQQGPTT
jgi:raffinose/stachyose/melibiose transport system substrate-binding protein